MNKVVRIGLLGCGVVGSNVVKLLHEHTAAFSNDLEVRFEVVQIAVRDLAQQRDVPSFKGILTNDWKSIVTSDGVDIVVEVMGGEEPARTAMLMALEAGKDVVTANKLVLALHGEALYRTAEQQGCRIFHEASVLGGVPVVRTLERAFTGNPVHRIEGIVNGTCNFVLTNMTLNGASFQNALAMAQTYGYAEADAALDIQGLDAAYKLQILVRLAFGRSINVKEMQCSGIECVNKTHIQTAKRLGLKLKHMVFAEMKNEVIYTYIGPVMITSSHPLYAIEDVDNGLVIHSQYASRITLTGPGAGGPATASAVLADLIQSTQAINVQSLVPEAKVAEMMYTQFAVIQQDEQIIPCIFADGMSRTGCEAWVHLEWPTRQHVNVYPVLGDVAEIPLWSSSAVCCVR